MKYYSVSYQVLKNGHPFRQDDKGLANREEDLPRAIDLLKEDVKKEFTKQYPDSIIEIVLIPGGIIELRKEDYDQIFTNHSELPK